MFLSYVSRDKPRGHAAYRGVDTALWDDGDTLPGPGAGRVGRMKPEPVVAFDLPSYRDEPKDARTRRLRAMQVSACVSGCCGDADVWAACRVHALRVVVGMFLLQVVQCRCCLDLLLLLSTLAACMPFCFAVILGARPSRHGAVGLQPSGCCQDWPSTRARRRRPPTHARAHEGLHSIGLGA
jgi:hypothetical protein